MTRGLCAYAITREHTPEPDVRLVTHAGLALAVAEVDLAPFAQAGPNPGEAGEDGPLAVLTRRHEAVVRTMFERTPVLPLRFGTLLRDEPAAVRLLTEYHEEAATFLDRVANHREWAVRARLPRPDTPAGPPVEGLPAEKLLAVRRDRLAAAARTRRDGSAGAAALHEALARHATETVQRKRKSGIPLLDAAYLVRVEDEPAFHAEVEAHQQLEVEVTGPLPPYSFVRLELDTEAVAHA
jgi:gas vesicle protein GvpL/GvpF